MIRLRAEPDSTPIWAREMGADRISAGLAALRAAVDKQSGQGKDGERAEHGTEGVGPEQGEDGDRVKPAERPKTKDGLDDKIKNRPKPRGLNWER